MLKYITIFPEYPVSVGRPTELGEYRRKILHARIEAPTLIPALNGPSPLLRTADGHHVNKAFIVGVRDYADPRQRKSPQAEYERRTQVPVYVTLELVTLEEVSVVVSVRRISDDLEVCLERALTGEGAWEFIGARTDWKTTTKLDQLLDPALLRMFEESNLTQSFLAINKRLIKNFTVIRPLGADEPMDEVTRPPD
jgi:hypothetical protein